MDDRPPALSFAALNARIEGMPDGPASILKTPRFIHWLNILGSIAIVFGLLPFLLAQFLTPQWWMVRMAQAGVWSAGILYMPGIVRGLAVMAREFWHWRMKLVAQSDHDLAQFRRLRTWLQTFPRAELEAHRNFARLSYDRLGSKLVLLMGGLERAGVLPVLVAGFFLLREVDGLGLESLADVPLWQGVLAPILVVTWWVGVIAVRMRLTYELYAMVLTDALEHRAATRPDQKGL